MTGTLRAAVVVGAVTAGFTMMLASACSSVPDVRFGDGGSTSSGGSSGGSSGEPEPPPLPDWACPDKPPSDGEGICCGNRICLKCAPSDCEKCEQEGCAGTVSAACCRRNPAQMTCRRVDGC